MHYKTGMLQGGRYAIIGIIAAAVIVATLTSLLQAPQTPAANTTGAPGQGSVLDLAAIAQHNTPRDCWTVIESTVYDITKYLNSHPGGPVISKACGNNATELFNTKGSNKPHSEFAHTLLAQFRIGTIGDIAPASPAQNIPADFAAVIGSLPKDSVQRYEFFIQNATGNYTVIFENGVVTIVPGNLPASAPPTTCIDITQAAKHSTRSDCWIAIANEFYDVTQYIPTHPGGASAITPYCGGKDATSAFNTKGGTGNTHSSFAQATLATFRVGALCTTTPTTLRATITQPLQEQVFPAGTKGVPALVTTPVAATCRYSNKDLKFSSMTGTFSSTGATAHAVSWPVSDGQTYTRYVRCEDTAGVAMTSSATVSFSVAAPLLTNATLDAATVAQHNTQSSCWLIISGYVYDVTTYISLHPGGASVLLSNCGKDATTAFNTKGGTGNTHSSTAQALLANYKLGKLVEGTPPVATITAPLANQLFGLGTVQTTLSVTTDEAATCRWSNTDQPFGTMTPFSMTGSTSHSATLSGLVAGQSYTTFVRCQDTSGNTMGSSVSVSYSISLLLDNTPPTATISAPTQGQQFTSSITTTTLSVSTNEAASCRWGTADTAYASLPNVFTSTGGVTHTTPLAGLTSGQSYTRYVRCQDLAGNAMTSSSTVSFSVAAQGSYTLAAVAQHSSQSSCWLAIHGAVYDVTSYLAIHPGGTTIILQNCGTDATTAFDTKAGSGTHSATALTLLENYRIGTLTDTTAPVVTITNPVANQAFSAGTTQATISVTTSETATCRGAVSAIPFGSMTQFSSTGATSHSTLLAALVNGGTYTYTVRCQDPASNEGSSSVTFSVATVADTSAPTATITAPTPNQAFNPGTTQATLSVTTNEAATCLWHTTNVAYASMTGTFSTTGGTSHTATIPSLANGGSYTRYVRCQDPAGNAMSTSASVSFSVMNTGTYTMAQVATHNTQGNCWIVVNANVYDVTAYIAIHPGGQAAIANECGTNATVAFNTKNGAGTHSNTAKNLLATYLLGTVSTLDNQPPVATITAPAAGQQLGSGTTSTTLSVTTDETATCRYSTTDQAYATMNAFTTTNAKTHSVTLSPLADGASYTYFVRCQDTAGNAMQSSQSISFSVSNTADTTAPTATIAAPSGQLAYTVKNTTLSVTTNEPATCRYGTSDTTYTNLPTPFTNTGTTGHSTTLTGLTAGTSYTYYVRCQDTANPPNSMQSSAVASFSLAAAPSYTMAQVATHNTLSSCWIVVQSSINNGVFDMTSFANTHPGGQQAIQINCGKNATRTFNVQDGHGTSERQILNGFWIGYVQ